jgi:hypothetical protein
VSFLGDVVPLCVDVKVPISLTVEPWVDVKVPRFVLTFIKKLKLAFEWKIGLYC